ncbi:hypothetical protein V497_01829 [Pseudogymnoascus sp. VKM F-4516 (FW-969)]|nr:hypothetical protein V497_01829 [Pseudogymnoascus sp. VKM F-4516 (FW-969)]
MEIHQGQSWGILELLTRLGDVDNINYRQHQQHMQHKTLLPANRTTVTSSNCSPWGRSDSDHPSSKSGILAVWLLLSFEVQPKAARFKARGAPATPTATPEGDPSKEHRNMLAPAPHCALRMEWLLGRHFPSRSLYTFHLAARLMAPIVITRNMSGTHPGTPQAHPGRRTQSQPSSSIQTSPRTQALSHHPTTPSAQEEIIPIGSQCFPSPKWPGG